MEQATQEGYVLFEGVEMPEYTIEALENMRRIIQQGEAEAIEAPAPGEPLRERAKRCIDGDDVMLELVIMGFDDLPKQAQDALIARGMIQRTLDLWRPRPKPDPDAEADENPDRSLSFDELAEETGYPPEMLTKLIIKDFEKWDRSDQMDSLAQSLRDLADDLDAELADDLDAELADDPGEE